MSLSKLKALWLSLLLAALPLLAVADEITTAEAQKHLPANVGQFNANVPARLSDFVPADKFYSLGVISTANRPYESRKGAAISVDVAVTRSESSAYALLTNKGCVGAAGAVNRTIPELGPKQCVSPTKILFARGPAVVELRTMKTSPSDAEALSSFARDFAKTLNAAEEDFPVLVKHLPGWPNVQDQQLFYAVSPDTLTEVVTDETVLKEINFTGGAEAVVANYGTQRLVLVEFNTASLATDNDGRIKAKLDELRSQGQATEVAYRRVGNYAVFVFGAPDQATANQLIDQVKYQQVVTWLGENPFSYEQATREFTETTLGVLVSVVKASGIALVSCLAIGGLAGALLFNLRRSQQRAREAYADSDAMLRLNIDELTPERDSSRLLGSGH